MILEKLQKIDFFNNLDIDLLKELSKFAKINTYEENSMLYYEGEILDEIYFVLSGEIKFYKYDSFENEVFLYKITKNLVFDFNFVDFNFKEFSTFSNAQFTKKTKILSININIFANFIKQYKAIKENIYKTNFKILGIFQNIIKLNVIYDAMTKVAFFINEDVENFNNLKKHEIAYMLHIQPETLSRVLKRLARLEIIQIDKNKIKIINQQKLIEIFKVNHEDK